MSQVLSNDLDCLLITKTKGRDPVEGAYWVLLVRVAGDFGSIRLQPAEVWARCGHAGAKRVLQN